MSQLTESEVKKANKIAEIQAELFQLHTNCDNCNNAIQNINNIKNNDVLTKGYVISVYHKDFQS